MNSDKIRTQFLEFFGAEGHEIVKSDSLIPSGDPTLLFTSAGMVQFKQHFLGQSKDKFTRAASSQKSFRTSDIEKVGYTNRHLTFFEMLGNFSFGDYFKKEAIAWGWEFLTKKLGIPEEKLVATVYRDDDEAFDIWKKIVPVKKIHRMGEDSNFWNMGPTGPCGPCSEILMDLGAEAGCRKPTCGPDCDCDRYLEVWNLVFTQFDRQADGSLKPLPRKNIDTGMGLERLVAAANGKSNVFETDLFLPLIKKLSEILNVGLKGRESKLRMMADHSRAIAFLICDGVLPSNEGRGYVLRRILRRALRQGRMFGFKEPFLYRMTAEVAAVMKGAYPELAERRENIASIAKMEEENFLSTLENGTRMLDELMAKYGSGAKKTGSVIPGEEVFKLYDTYGFPPDLTKEIAAEKGVSIDEKGFAAAQKRAQERSRASWSGSGEKDMAFYSKLNKELGDTRFEGYGNAELESKIAALVKGSSKTDELKPGEEGEVVLESTPFYPESGGQVTDTGTLKTGGRPAADVADVQKPAGGLIVHKIKNVRQALKTGMKITASVDSERRRKIMRHHTATHLLHKALREILGTHVTQAGSLVTPDYFRFDFTHISAMTLDQVKSAEKMVNEAVRRNFPVCIKKMNLDEAKKAGAMALFGEKYENTVRTVTVADEKDPKPFSMELCGGTHVANTGDIGFFKITSESSISSGTRRIEAVAGEAAENYIEARDNILADISSRFNTSDDELVAKTEKLLAALKESEKEIEKLKMKLASGGADDLISSARNLNGTKVVSGRLKDVDPRSLRELSDNLQRKLGSGVILLVSEQDGKISFVASVSDDKVKSGFNAGRIAKNFAGIIGGSGGGKPDFAQGGGKDASKIDTALSRIEEIVS
ncbi:MAG: alanine--tRNA ligase [Endomicrobiales bacterium]|nr:alanine--tRNA ligase [Endomicrobiales bacterium]